jgi:hypothetical protein
MRRAERDRIAVVLLLLAVLVSPAPAAEVAGSGRVQTAAVHDDNVLEAMDPGGRRSDDCLRILGDGRLDIGALPLGSRAEMSLRVLSEWFRDYPAEDRRQAEASLAWVAASAATRRSLALEGGYGLRAYPDSTIRGHHRVWGRATGAVPMGPRGSLIGRFDLWQLDFRSTARVDQLGGAFDLSMEHPVARRLTLQGGLELSAVHHGVGALRFLPSQDPPELDPNPGPDRRDQGSFLHVGFRRAGRVILRAQVGYRTQTSNSIDGALRRPEATWLVSSPLGWRVTGQFYGNLKHTRYTALRGMQVTRTGEIDAGDDDNTIAVRLARPLGGGWDVDVRGGVYRNEAAFVGAQYRKRVVSMSVSRSFGVPSSF